MKICRLGGRSPGDGARREEPRFRAITMEVSVLVKTTVVTPGRLSRAGGDALDSHSRGTQEDEGP